MTRFEMAVARLLTIEAGYVDIPEDRGGPTNMGITLPIWKEFHNGVDGTVDDIKNLTPGLAKMIYQKLFWDGLMLDGMLYPVAEVMFDQAVLRGRHGATLTLQMALGVPTDGVIGNQTLQAIRERSYPRKLAAAFLRLSAQQFCKICVAHPEQLKFLVGWTDRIFSLIDTYVLGG